MSLLYKPDWTETQTRLLNWWAGEAMDRCAMSITAPKQSVPDTPAPEIPGTPLQYWTDLDLAAARNRYAMERTAYLGEALPIWTVGYPGHTAIPAFLGCPTELAYDTGWWEPILHDEDLDGVFDLRINPQHPWWTFALNALRRAVQESRDACLPSTGAFGGCGDTLAALRGSEQLLVDVIERPDQVRAAEDYLMSMWFEVYDAFYAITHEAAEGSVGWFPLWSPGRFYAAQNDFSYMISPKQFDAIFLPVIDRQTRFLDHTIYHVDGIGAFAHVPALCSLPHLQALQILPGAGKPSPLHYMEVLQAVQRAGKNLHITIPACEVEMALTHLSSRGLFIETWCATEDEAQELLRCARKWSHL